MAQRRVFTLEEVDALIPKLAILVERQLERETHIEQSLARLVRLNEGLPRTLEAEHGGPPAVEAQKAELRRLIEVYERGWHDVHALGAVVKDPQLGLVDFYGRVDGRLVWLCWRFGESAVRYYHELDAGFSARKALRPEARTRMLN